MTKYLDNPLGATPPPVPTMTTKARTNPRVKALLWWMMAAIVVLVVITLFMSHAM